MGCCLSSKFKSNCTVDSSFNPYADGLSSRIESGTIPLNQRTELEILNSSNLRSFSYNNLRTATRNFRPDSLLGEGGFGCVFKGWINEQTLAAARPGTGMVIAVKRLNKEGFQGQQEWLAEINYLSQLHHPNVVKLIGYCTEEDERLLVYEFLPRGSLENHLFRRSSYFQPLSWDLRMKVALGAAKGLAFLHSQKVKVISRDFKSSNILIDTDYSAKLSDFGLAKDGPTGEKSHVSTRVLGTHGYAAPEYLATGHLTTRSDVYSFGVVLLELMTGRRALDANRHPKEQNLTKWAQPYLKSKRKFFRIMDTRIQGQYCQSAAAKVGMLAMQCLSQNPRLRPNMKDVVENLEGLQGPENVHISRHQQHGLEVNSEFGVHRRRKTNRGGGRKVGVPTGYDLPRPPPVVVCAREDRMEKDMSNKNN